MRKSFPLTTAIWLAATLALTLSATAQQEREHHQGPHPQGQQGHPGAAYHPPAGPPAVHPGAAYHPPAGPPGGHPGQAFRQPGPGPHGGHVVHALGERGYSFRAAGGVRREIVAFSPRERQIWLGGRWHHERRFGRLGYWYEVNGSWYFYDRPFDGPPTYVSEVEFMDPDLGAPEEVDVVPAPVVVVPPALCIGPLCVR